MAKNSYSNRTTLWDDQAPQDSPAPQATVSRGKWRAPSSAIAGERGGRRWPSSMVAGEEGLDGAVSSRRRSFAAERQPWWKPRTNFGRIVLGTGAFISLSLLVALGLFTRHFLYRDPHFRIRSAASVQANGLSEVNRAEFLPVFSPDIGRNVFFVPLGQRRSEVEAIPWVRQATVMRILPDRISVKIIERTPVAFVRLGQRIELMDADGVILSMTPALMTQHHYSFPVVTGVGQNDSRESRRIKIAVYERFVGELDHNGQRRTDQVSEIDLSDPEDLRATMPEQGADVLAHFGEDQFLSRYEIYKSHVGAWRARYPSLVGVDLRYSGEVPLEMAKGSSRDSVTAAVVQDSENAKGSQSRGIADTGSAAGPATGRQEAVAKPQASVARNKSGMKPEDARPVRTREGKSHEGKARGASLREVPLRREARTTTANQRAARTKAEKAKAARSLAHAHKQIATHATTAR